MPAAVFGATIFLSAFLLFLIQPVFAKLILPWFGGSSAVWSTCLVFFQTALLAGYAYAHLLTRRVAARWQPWVHSALLAAALAVLPVLPSGRWKPAADADPALQILAMLAVVLGLPYVLLSSTSPLLQKWMSRTRSPYRFFALSNLGSLLALAAYPVLIEPRIPTRKQDVAWSAAFAVFVVLCGAASWIGRPRTEEQPAPAVKPEHPVLWLLLAATGSMFLVSTTSHMTQNVAAVPFLWILPLSAYLLSFIICFDSPRWYKREFFLRLLAVALASLAYALYDIQVSDAIIVAIPLFTAGLFIACMFCHGELSRLKPDAGGLTTFYLMIALGGALGAVFTGLIAPRVFAGIYEFPLSLVLAAALALWLNWRQGWAQRVLWAAVTVATIAALGEEVRGYHQDVLALERSFYGSLRVVQSGGMRTLLHGTVKHGVQFQDERRSQPTAYFGPQSGAGQVLQASSAGPKRVGIIGLGAGTLAAYGNPGDSFRFYEINPQVVALAKSHFTFLSDSKASIDISLGDARLSLEREPVEPYDVFLADAFSGDSIPVHLLTNEAFDLYLRHLKPHGTLAVHVSNQYLNLAPVVAQLAAAHGMQAVLIASPKDDSHAYFQADWVVMTRGEPFPNGKPIAPRSGRPWSDDYNNLLEVFRF